jgi:predicted O-methyltransferase YrrM
MSTVVDPKIQKRIEELQTQSVAQEAAIGEYFGERAKKRDLSWDGLDADANKFMADKLVALEPVKAEFCAMLCRALRAKRVVEIGTSYGVSTLYLADALRSNGGGVVIGTEYEPAKAAAARATFIAAGVADLIDLREGDLRQTLKNLAGPIDFVLMDIWTEMARPAMELVAPHLRKGAVIIADNTVQFKKAYRFFFEYVENPANGLRTMTLPFNNGLDMIVKE